MAMEATMKQRRRLSLLVVLFCPVLWALPPVPTRPNQIVADKGLVSGLVDVILQSRLPAADDGGQAGMPVAAVFQKTDRGRLQLILPFDKTRAIPLETHPLLTKGMDIIPVKDGRYLICHTGEALHSFEVTPAGLRHRHTLKGLDERSVFAVYDDMLALYTARDQIVVYSVPDFQEIQRFLSPFEGRLSGIGLHGVGRRQLYAAYGNYPPRIGTFNLDRMNFPQRVGEAKGRLRRSTYKGDPMLAAPAPAWGRPVLATKGLPCAVFDPEKEGMILQRDMALTTEGILLDDQKRVLRYSGESHLHHRNPDNLKFIINMAGTLWLGLTSKTSDVDFRLEGPLLAQHGRRHLVDVVFTYPKNPLLNDPLNKICGLVLLEREALLLIRPEYIQYFSVPLQNLQRFLEPKDLVMLSKPPDTPRQDQDVEKVLKVLSGSGGVTFEVMTAPAGFSLSRDGKMRFRSSGQRKRAEVVMLRVRNQAGGEIFFGFEI